tara:strand:+ start:1758 stop:2183 length:426 start_codon:yes stop_codon:yes gene_type:complete
MFYFSVWKIEERTEDLNNFEKLLSPEQKEIYANIKQERRNIYLSGYSIGFFLSIMAILYYRNNSKTKLTKTNMICLIFTISFITNYFYYILSPKSNYMILHLDKQEEKEAWLKIYKSMQYNYHFGFVLGIIALLFLTHGTC